MGDIGKAVRFVRNNLILLAVLSVWTVLAWLCQSWWRGLGAMLTIGAGLFVLRFVNWRKARLVMLAKADLEAPKLAELAWAFLAETRRVVHVRRQWRKVCQSLGLTSPALKVVPKLRHITGTINGDLTAGVFPGAVHADVEAFQKCAPKMAGMIRGGCKDVTVRVTSPGNARIDFVYSEPLKGHMGLADSPKSPDKRMYVLGAQENGRPILVPKNRSALLAAFSGCGKSNEIYYIIQQMLADGDWLWLYVSDVGGTEMAEFGDHVDDQQGQLNVRYYATTVEDTKAMLAKAVKDMSIRQAWMAKQSPKIRELNGATQANPRALICLDEQVLIQDLYKGGTNNDLGTLYTNGRKVDFVVLGGSQDARAVTIPGALRATIPTRWCGPVADPDSTECILGKGAVGKGARSHELDRFKDVGLFYTGSEDSRWMTLGRAPKLTEQEKDMTARGIVAPAMRERRIVGAPPKPYVIYRAFDDSTRWARMFGKRPVYIGITNDWERRRGEHERLDWKWCDMHRRMENYWDEHVAKWDVDPLKTTDIRVAQAAEKKAIYAECPVFNDHHNRGGLIGRKVQGWFHRAPVTPSEPLEGAVLPPVAALPVRRRARLVAPVNGHVREDWSE